GAFVRRAAEIYGESSASEADDRQVAQYTGDLGGHAEGGIYSHHIENKFGALSPCHVFNTRNGRVAGDQHLVRAHGFSNLELIGRGVYGNDRRRPTERSQNLDGHLAQTAS